MGLLKSVNDITYELQDSRQQKETEKLEKENKRIHQNNLKKKLQETFYTYLKENQDNLDFATLKLGQIDMREQIIAEVPKHVTSPTAFDMSYLNEIYTKELQAMARTFKPVKEYKKILEKERKMQEQEQEQQKGNSFLMSSTVKDIIITICILIFTPLLFVLFVISAAIKNI